MKTRFEPVAGRNAEIIEAVMGAPEVISLPEEFQFKLRLCVEEAEENILGYSGSDWVEVSLWNEDGRLAVEFRDGGVAFDPTTREEYDVNAPLQERQMGGLGIFLCRQMSSSLEYRREEGCNVLTMKF